jgi:hypothetical protein
VNIEDPIGGLKILEGMAATYKDRNGRYKANYLKVGKIMSILYPDGVTLKTPEDFTRWHLLEWMVGKLTRFSAAGDVDSIHDVMGYALMLEGWVRHEKELKDGP